MNQFQENFYQYVMARVIPGKEKEARKILLDAFDKQDRGQLTPEYIMLIAPKLLILVKMQAVPELTGAIGEFAKQ
jgi:hypothetical protein